jgi:hypothetical protein
VVIVSLDGVRWQDVFGTHAPPPLSQDPTLDYTPPALPELQRLMADDGAALGHPDSASVFSVAGPSFASLPGYTQLFAGRSTVACFTNACERTTEPTLMDRVGARYGASQAVLISSWPDLERAALAAPDLALASAGRNGGTGRELLASTEGSGQIALAMDLAPDPGAGDYRPDEYTQLLGHSILETMQPRLLFIGLGDTDEYAHQDNYARYRSTLEQTDAWLGQMVSLASQLADEGHSTAFFITTDHGRGESFVDHVDDPAAGRTWLIAAGAAIGARGPLDHDAALADLAPTVAYLLGIDLPTASGQVLFELL